MTTKSTTTKSATVSAPDKSATRMTRRDVAKERLSVVRSLLKDEERGGLTKVEIGLLLMLEDSLKVKARKPRAKSTTKK